MILIPCTPSVNYPLGPFPCLGVKYQSNISFRKYYYAVCLISEPTLISVPAARFSKEISMPTPNKRAPYTKLKLCQKSCPPP